MKKEKFEDHSLIVAKGNTYVAVILGCVVEEDNKKIFFSHKGTSFGGIVVNKKYYSVTHMNQIFDLFEKLFTGTRVQWLCYEKKHLIYFQKSQRN